MRETLDYINESRGIAAIVEGGAPGVDEHAKDWDQVLMGDVQHLPFEADWKKQQTSRPDQKTSRCSTTASLACPGDKGTAEMVKRTRAAGIEYWR